MVPAAHGGKPLVSRCGRIFWGAIASIDCWVWDVRFRICDAVYGPEPEAEADRQRGCDREPWRRSGLRQPPR
jgi:hypothetical protein